MKTTLFLALLLLSLNSEGASAARSEKDIAAKKAEKKAGQALWRATNQAEIKKYQATWRAAKKAESASSLLVGGKLFFDVEPLGPDEDTHAEDIAAIAAARREAKSEKQRARRAANPGSRKKEAEQQKKYRADNREEIAAKRKAWRAAKQEKINAQRREHRSANPGSRKKEAEQQKQRRDAAKLKSASSWLVGGKSLFDVKPLGPDEDAHVDLAGFAFGAGEDEHVDLAGFAFGAGGRKRARSDGAKGGPATKK